MKNSSVILFDGVCNLCNSAVQFVIRHDKKNRFVFASLQSPEAHVILNNLHFSDEGGSFILVENDVVFQKSTAALRVLKNLAGLWPVLYVFIIVPLFIRDYVYKIISKNRYKWFGKKNECMVPTKELQSKFLSYN